LAAYSNLKVTPAQQSLLAQIADTIIPPGKLKGAQDLAIQDFILVMVNDCVAQTGQTQFTIGLQAFNSFSKKKGGKNFSKLESTTKEKVIAEGLSKEKVIAEGLSIGAETTDENQKAVREFLSITKRFTIQGFMMSQYIMTEIKPYSLIPGSYNGEVLISSISNMKIDG